MTRTIDAAEAAAAVRNVVRFHPGSKNPRGGAGWMSCVYTSEGLPDCHCLIGQAIADLGGQLPPADAEPNRMGIKSMIEAFDTGLEFTDDALRIFVLCQAHADCFRDTTWGDMRDVIDERIDRVLRSSEDRDG